MNIKFYPACASVVTDESGEAEFVIKIPGTFSTPDGFSSPTSDGRYLKSFQVWADNGKPGDRLTDIRIEDVDGVVPLQMRALFPNYPIVQYLDDNDIQESSKMFKGIALPIGCPLMLTAIDPIDSRGLIFIPSQLYIKASFISGDNALGRRCSINCIWGKYA